MPKAFAHGVVDQQSIGSSTTGATVNGPGAEFQTFVPTSRDIIGVDVVLNEIAATTHIIDVLILDTDGITILTSAIGVNTGPLSGPTTVHVDLPFTSLTPGFSYFIAINSADSGFTWTYEDPGTYSFGEATIADTAFPTRDFNFATYASSIGASGSQYLQAKLNLLQNCGLNLSGTLSYGSLSPNAESTTDRVLTLQNIGSVASDVFISGDDWLDALSVVQMLVGVTHYSTTGPDLVLYGNKTPLTQSLLTPLATVSPGASLPTFWQIQLVLENITFSGFLSQPVTFTFDCLVDFILYTNEPTDTDVGATINSGTGFVVAEIRDSNNLLLTSFNEPVIVKIGTDPSGGTAILSGTTIQNAVGGIVTFDDLSIDVIGTGYTLIVRTGGLNDFESSPFDIILGTP